MSILFKNTNSVILNIEEFFDTIDKGVLTFKEGVSNYINKNMAAFENNLKQIDKLESTADELLRKVENDLYVHSLLPQYRGDVLRLMDKTDDIIDTAKENLYQFDVEIPKIPEELNEEYIKLTEISVLAVEALIPAAKAFFTDPKAVKERLHRVFFYEKEADQLANAIKRRLFREMPELKLSEKMHLRYFALHIEHISDVANAVADILSVLAIKRTV